MSRVRQTRTRRRARFAALVLAVALLGSPAAVQADEYDPDWSGHPLRIIAYAAHPVGFLIDRLLLRPAHWVGSRAFVRDLFGHEDFEYFSKN